MQKTRKFLLRLCLCVTLAAGLWMSFVYMRDTKRAEKDRQEALKTVEGGDSSAKPSSAPYVPPGPDSRTDSMEERQKDRIGETSPKSEAYRPKQMTLAELPEEAAGITNIDVKALKEVNADVLGWIELPGTKLSYPLLQGEDNEVYLDHNWKKEPLVSGSIFLECTNKGDFSGFHTIIYGHRMKDNSMFGVLKYYESHEFWKEHPAIYIANGESVRCYRIFAAHETDVKGMVYRLDLEKRNLEEEFVRFCLENSVLDVGEEENSLPKPGAPILTLSTCTGRGHDTRWVVQGYLLEIYSNSPLDEKQRMTEESEAIKSSTP